MMDLLRCLILVAVTWSIESVLSANILLYMGMASPSHKLGFLTYVNGLVQQGHQVTFISPYPTKGAKFRDISPKLLQEAISHLTKRSFIGIRLHNDQSSYWASFSTFALSTCEAALKSPEIEDIVTGKEKFDLVILDPLANECGYGFAHVSEAPVILYNTAGIYNWNTAPFGLPSSAIFEPSHAFLYNRDIRKFKERLIAVLANTFYDLRRNWWTFPEVESMWEQRLGRPVPSFAEIEQNTAILLLNSHPIVEPPHPYMANMISIGGIHFQNETVPKDLDEIASGSGNDGFVLFSLGSIVQAKTLPQEYYQAFVEAFRRLPQRVLWKWESDGEELKKLPKNVFARKWLPQHGLLAHPKCRGFVTHGGKLGMLEAIQEGVPMVVIPFFADQDLHAELAQSGGFGLALDLVDVTADTLYQSISSIVNEPRFKEKAVQSSRVLKDQPDTPLSRAIYWTEFVLRHPETEHFRAAARHFTWYQYHMLDVWAFVAFLISIPLFLTVIFSRCFLRSFLRKTPKKVKSN